MLGSTTIGQSSSVTFKLFFSMLQLVLLKNQELFYILNDFFKRQFSFNPTFNQFVEQ